MCVTSLVTTVLPNQLTQWSVPTFNRDRTDEVLAEIWAFKELVAASRQFDVVSKQTDCVDPEKAVLLARVDQLEKDIQDLRIHMAARLEEIVNDTPS